MQSIGCHCQAFGISATLENRTCVLRSIGSGTIRALEPTASPDAVLKRKPAEERQRSRRQRVKASHAVQTPSGSVRRSYPSRLWHRRKGTKIRRSTPTHTLMQIAVSLCVRFFLVKNAYGSHPEFCSSVCMVCRFALYLDDNDKDERSRQSVRITGVLQRRVLGAVELPFSGIVCAAAAPIVGCFQSRHGVSMIIDGRAWAKLVNGNRWPRSDQGFALAHSRRAATRRLVMWCYPGCRECSKRCEGMSRPLAAMRRVGWPERATRR